MDSVLSPPLSGIAQARFVAVGRQLLPLGDWLDDGLINQLIEREAEWAESAAGRRELRGESAAYRASVRALLDLVRIGWRVEVERGTIELIPPSRLRARLTPQQVRCAKEETRRNLWPLVAAQLDQPEFRKFVRRLEVPTAKTKTRSVTDLVASGSELAARLTVARSLPVDRRGEALAGVVRPYLQLVTEETRDAFTSHPLGEIWRYFRATWSIPNLPVPGRSMLYLVRDAAHPLHAVMGLIALNNAPMRKRALDDWAGWTPARLRADAEARRQSSNPQGALSAFASSCVEVLRDAASAICLDGLATSEEIERPDPITTRRLLELGDRYYDLREKVLKDIERQKKLGIAFRSCKPPASIPTRDLPPLDDHLPDLEKTPDPASRLARRLLIAKKRAHELSRLLQARLAFSEHFTRLADPTHAAEAWARDEIVSALGVVCGAMKSARLSSNILEVTTCGAVAPYHHLLGGKLAALLCASPELGADYQARYGGEPAIIRSHMANRLVPADCRLAAVVTTSLYGVGSSQYERLRLPAGAIAPSQGEFRIRRIGESSGFGTVHFSPETMADLEHLLLQKDEFTDAPAARDFHLLLREGDSPEPAHIAKILRGINRPYCSAGFEGDDAVLQIAA